MLCRLDAQPPNSVVNSAGQKYDLTNQQPLWRKRQGRWGRALRCAQFNHKLDNVSSLEEEQRSKSTAFF